VRAGLLLGRGVSVTPFHLYSVLILLLSPVPARGFLDWSRLKQYDCLVVACGNFVKLHWSEHVQRFI
jgi:hypothetical protein